MTRHARGARDEVPGFYAGAARFGRGVSLGPLLRGRDPRTLRQDGSAVLAEAGVPPAVARAWLGHPAVPSRGVAVLLGDPCYPPALAALDRPPPFLCVEGDPAALADAHVAVVGTRACSARGEAVAWSLGAALAASGVAVASGLARGIDAAAHRGALCTGRTVAVVAHGLAFTAPPSHRRLREEIVNQGAIVSPFLDDVEPRPHTFPMRNPVVAGLARAVIVVEAPERSGALITARAAAEFGRSVLVFTRGAANAGAAGLAIDGAVPIDSIASLLADRAGWRAASRLLAHLVEGDALDAIAREEGIPVQRLLEEVGRLEREGAVVRRAGERYAVVRGSA